MKKLGFIGSGNMAESLVKGLLTSGVFTKEQIIMSDILGERLQTLSSLYGVSTTQKNTEVAKLSDILVLAVKPNTIGEVIREIRGYINQKKIIVSIAAGITTSFISERIKKKAKIVRVMPNTPALVLSGASVLYCSPLITQEEREEVKKIFETVGIVYTVEDENLIDAATGLSGSGPAFVSMFIEALSDGGVNMGLPRNMAIKLAAQTVYGTSKMILETNLHPAELKDRVASPAGTTIEGIRELEIRGFRGSVISAVKAASERSKALSKEEK
ncbi:MAG: pyrroline-5-carboxylate reductase [Deltaproteobacteria bacterium]|jgi:pyrroline-5-carboxylate reductase|nr:MAG: pyrroline-5-carboxylate reductase [Deltaproteobacteria bacterium]